MKWSAIEQCSQRQSSVNLFLFSLLQYHHLKTSKIPFNTTPTVAATKEIVLKTVVNMSPTSNGKLIAVKSTYFWNFGIVHFRIFLSHFSSLAARPNHEGVHWSLHVACIWAALCYNHFLSRGGRAGGVLISLMIWTFHGEWMCSRTRSSLLWSQNFASSYYKEPSSRVIQWYSWWRNSRTWTEWGSNAHSVSSFSLVYKNGDAIYFIQV